MSYVLKVRFDNKRINNEDIPKSLEMEQDDVIKAYYEQKSRMDYVYASGSKTFSERGNLKIHISIIHDGRKEYGCGSCTKTFTTIGNMEKHINSVHELYTSSERITFVQSSQ